MSRLLLNKWRLHWSGFQGFVTVAKSFSGPKAYKSLGGVA